MAQDRNFTFRSACDVAAKKYITLADEAMKELDVCAWGPARNGHTAAARCCRRFSVSGYLRTSRMSAAA